MFVIDFKTGCSANVNQRGIHYEMKAKIRGCLLKLIVGRLRLNTIVECSAPIFFPLHERFETWVIVFHGTCVHDKLVFVKDVTSLILLSYELRGEY